MNNKILEKEFGISRQLKAYWKKKNSKKYNIIKLLEKLDEKNIEIIMREEPKYKIRVLLE